MVEADEDAVDVMDVDCVDVPVELAVLVAVVYSQLRKRPPSHLAITVLRSTSSGVLHVVPTKPKGFWHENTASDSPSK